VEAQTYRTLWDSTNRELNAVLLVMRKHNKLKKEDKVYSWNPISHFSHDKVPVTFFMDKTFIQNFVRAARNLHTLHISLDARDDPLAEFWTRFASAISSCTELKDLRFGFQHRDNTKNWTTYLNQDGSNRLGRVALTETLLDDTVHDSYVPLWKSLSKTLGQNLRNFKLMA
jgi:hypothetical protein